MLPGYTSCELHRAVRASSPLAPGNLDSFVASLCTGLPHLMKVGDNGDDDPDRAARPTSIAGARTRFIAVTMLWARYDMAATCDASDPGTQDAAWPQ